MFTAGLWENGVPDCKKAGEMIYCRVYDTTARNGKGQGTAMEAYRKLGARERILTTVDGGSFSPWFDEVQETNPLGLAGYIEKQRAAREKSGATEAVTVGRARIGGIDVVIGACDTGFMMGSMGYVMGERITRAFEEATRLRLPVVMFCCSGGARMQEGAVSLMQMAKTSAAVKRHSNAGLFYCSVLTDPTLGGVTASFAMIADIILAEPRARVGFAGPRVIQQTIGQTLPEGFQTSEFMLDHGMVDSIVEREKLPETLRLLLSTHMPGRKWNAADDGGAQADAFAAVQKTPWEKIKMCRSRDRATAREFIDALFDDFMELHGDRYFSDDRAMIGGIAHFCGMPLTVVGMMRGKTMEESFTRNFGMPKPEGYRKALRLMKQAEKFGRPIVTLINTSGAYPGVDAEERGQGEAIARSVMEMFDLTVPVLAILIGEGGSGGALAAAIGNEVWMLENATYAILSPEGYSSILYKTESRAEEAAGLMKLTAQDLERMGVIDRIIPEYGGATAETAERIAAYIRRELQRFFSRYDAMDGAQISAHRHARFRAF